MNHAYALVAALLITGLSFSTTARAEAPGHASREVTVSALELSTRAGRKAVEQRIEKAANAVCFDPTGPAPGGHVDPVCKAEALNKARRQLESMRTHKILNIRAARSEHALEGD